LTAAGRRYFGSWDEALRASGIQPGEVRKVKKWDWYNVNRGIIARIESGKSLQASIVQQEEPDLYHAVVRKGGKWYDAVNDVTRHCRIDTNSEK
jgi:hypothetical protein